MNMLSGTRFFAAHERVLAAESAMNGTSEIRKLTMQRTKGVDKKSRGLREAHGRRTDRRL